MIGVCIPWQQSNVTSGRKDGRSWEDHIEFCELLRAILERLADPARPMVLAGDFNQRMPLKHPASRHARASTSRIT